MADARKGRKRLKQRAEGRKKTHLPERFTKMIEAGVSAFVPQDASPGDLLNTIRSVAGGEKVFPSARTRRPRQKRYELRGPLSGRDREIIAMLSDGFTRGQIARSLAIMPSDLDRLGFRILQSLCAAGSSGKPGVENRSPRRS